MSDDKGSGERPIRLVILAGEPSGERQGGALFTAFRTLSEPIPVEAWGCGGEHMRASGVDVLYDCTRWAAIGVVGLAASIPSLLMIRRDLMKRLRKDPPDVLILIDAGAFNVPIGRWAKRTRICKVFYYFPPGSWRRPRGPSPARDVRDRLADAADLIVTPFPWSETYLRSRGANVRFVGHPSLDLVDPQLSDDEFYGRFGLDPLRPLIALLPGSRRMEIASNLPALIGAAAEISQRIPGVQFALALAQSSSRTLVEEMVRREQSRGGRAASLNLMILQAGGRLAQIAQNTLMPPPPVLATDTGVNVSGSSARELLSRGDRHSRMASRDRTGVVSAPLVICDGLTYDVMSRSDLVITKSGTATLEATILQRPMIIIYKGSRALTLEWKLRRKRLNIQQIGMPNLMAEERIFPELLADDATPEAISNLAVDILLQPERLIHLKERLTVLVNECLGTPGGVLRAAELLNTLVPRR